MIEVDFVIKVHEILINEFGGTHGIRDLKSLKSALGRPFASFDQQELYPSIFDKAAALIESLISNLIGSQKTGQKLKVRKMSINLKNLSNEKNQKKTLSRI